MISFNFFKKSPNNCPSNCLKIAKGIVEKLSAVWSDIKQNKEIFNYSISTIIFFCFFESKSLLKAIFIRTEMTK